MKNNIFILLFAITISFFSSCTKQDEKNAIKGWENLIEKEKPSNEKPSGLPSDKWFKMRGLVLGWDEVSNPYVIDYIDIAKENGINTLSIYNAPMNSELWSEFKRKCAEASIDIEYEEHMMSFLLPRELFEEHPEYFRMNKDGVRINDANACPSSNGAIEQIKINAKKIALNYVPTNNKYYFWLDDGGDICYCDKCKKLNASDQALIFENAALEAVKQVNSNAMVAHLCYLNTLDAPKSITPSKDIFLEFAPFFRTWSQPLANTWAKGRNNLTHADYLRALKENLKVFPVETAQVLEYWMDDSLFSDWDLSNLKQVPWDNEIFKNDIATYASYGIRHITCYAAYVGPSYVHKFGFPSFLSEYGQGLLNYEKK